MGIFPGKENANRFTMKEPDIWLQTLIEMECEAQP